jgi:hypothetical protein
MESAKLGHLRILPETYVDASTKADFICPEHGQFSRIVLDLIKSKYGCSTCGNEASVRNRKVSSEEFLKRAKEVHGDEFEYDLSGWVNTTTKIPIKCRDHGWFMQKPFAHVNQMNGCKACYLEIIAKAGEIPFSEFERRARKIHYWKYHYWTDNYRGMSEKVRITCPDHGDFWQRGSDHIEGHGCPSCGGRGGSAGEQEIADFVLSLGYTPERSVKIPNSNMEIDVYVPELKVGFEYHGVYWHSSKFQKQTEHKRKFDATQAAGIKVLQFYSDEWIRSKEACKYLIAGSLGKGSESIGARDTSVKSVDADTAKVFLIKWHIQGFPGQGDYYGLFESEVLVALMGFSKVASSRSRLGDNSVELVRYASSKRVVSGATKLMKAYLRRNPSVKKVISYSDNRLFTGKMYESMGFKLDGDVAASYYYCTTKANLRWHKSNFQRKHLPNRLEHFDPALSERQNCEANGYYQIWDCGKKRWILEVTSQNE